MKPILTYFKKNCMLCKHNTSNVDVGNKEAKEEAEKNLIGKCYLENKNFPDEGHECNNFEII